MECHVYFQLTSGGTPNKACAAFLPNEDVLPTCLYYFLSSKKEQFMHDGVGGAQPNISAGYLKEVEFSVVPLERNWRWLID